MIKKITPYIKQRVIMILPAYIEMVENVVLDIIILIAPVAHQQMDNMSEYYIIVGMIM